MGELIYILSFFNQQWCLIATGDINALLILILLMLIWSKLITILFWAVHIIALCHCHGITMLMTLHFGIAHPSKHFKVSGNGEETKFHISPRKGYLHPIHSWLSWLAKTAEMNFLKLQTITTKNYQTPWYEYSLIVWHHKTLIVKIKVSYIYILHVLANCHAQ